MPLARVATVLLPTLGAWDASTSPSGSLNPGPPVVCTVRAPLLGVVVVGLWDGSLGVCRQNGGGGSLPGLVPAGFQAQRVISEYFWMSAPQRRKTRTWV